MSPHSNELVFEYSDAEQAAVIARAVEQETGEIDDERSREHLSRDGQVVTIDIEADDLTALRAATNTWLSLCSVAERVAATP